MGAHLAGLEHRDLAGITILAVRLVSVSAWGHYTTALAFITIATVFASAGVATHALREMSDDIERQGAILGTGLTAIAGVAVLAAVAVVPIAAAFGYGQTSSNSSFSHCLSSSSGLRLRCCRPPSTLGTRCISRRGSRTCKASRLQWVGCVRCGLDLARPASSSHGRGPSLAWLRQLVTCSVAGSRSSESIDGAPRGRRLLAAALPSPVSASSRSSTSGATS